MSPLTQALVYVIQTIFSLYLLIVVIRLLLQLVRADFYNPISQFAVRATDPVLAPLRKVLPGHRRIDFPALILAILVQMLSFTIVIWLHTGMMVNPLNLFLWALLGLLVMLFNVFFFCLIIEIILSWVAPHSYHPASQLIRQINDPLMQPARRLLPPTGGLDLSPLLVFMMLNVLNILLLSPLAEALGVPRGLILGL